MKAVLMAGGEGSRLRPLTSARPKPMAAIANRPLMEHSLNLLRRYGLTETIATVHYLADEIESYFGDGAEFGVQMQYVVEDTPLGTAGSVKEAESELTDTFLIISGDGLTDFDLGKAIAFHRERGSIATLVLTRVPKPLEFGVVITEADGRITRFLEKPGWSEVFSDTVNTGIYILEPEVLQYLRRGQFADFSADLFPTLLREGRPMFGYVAEGYWCDIGTLDQYLQASYDVLEGKVRLEIPGELRADGVWVGEGTEIDPEARIIAPALIGRNCQIGPEAHIGEMTTIGDNCRVESGASITRSVIGKNCYLGKRAEVSGAIICPEVIIKAHCTVGDGAVIGDGCVLGESTRVYPKVKLWPNKYTDPGARVSMSLVWGSKWPGSLFGAAGVSGVVNREITPEFATRLGAAFGAFQGAGARVVTGRDSHPAARMIKRATIAGLMSVGANVLDLRTMPSPVLRHAVVTSGAAGGVHVALSPTDPNLILLQFVDSQGRLIDRAAERKIEGIFFREDFQRTHRDAVGTLSYLARSVEHYAEDLLSFIDTEAIRRRRPTIVVDYAHGPLAFLMPALVGRMGCEAVGLNAFVDETREPLSWADRSQHTDQVSGVVSALHAEFGAILDQHGERLAIVDETGSPIPGDELLAAYVYLVLRTLPPGAASSRRVAVPVTATAAIEAVCASLDAEAVRTKADPRSLARVAGEEGVVFAGDVEGGFIFPEFQPLFDAVGSLGKLLEMLVTQETGLAAVRAQLPPIHKARLTVACPWEQKGALMRRLHQESRGLRTQDIDGLKIFQDGGWVLVLPDPSTPHFHLYAESASDAEAQAMAEQYRDRILALEENPEVTAE
jgi:mannose-1-phosphate guanylyltransferase/phosphomannomutase